MQLPVTPATRAPSTTAAREPIPHPCHDPQVQSVSLITIAQSTPRLLRLLQLRLSLRSKSLSGPIARTTAGRTAASSCAKDSDCGSVLLDASQLAADVFPR